MLALARDEALDEQPALRRQARQPLLRTEHRRDGLQFGEYRVLLPDGRLETWARFNGW